jgi:hypothetical protein
VVKGFGHRVAAIDSVTECTNDSLPSQHRASKTRDQPVAGIVAKSDFAIVDLKQILPKE